MVKKKNKVIQKTRRINGAGSIYQQKNGRWTGKIWIVDKATGERKRKTVYGQSQSEIADKFVKLTGTMSSYNGLYANKTFGQLFEEWLLIFKRTAVTPRTLEGNIRNFKLHILPYIGNMDVTEVTAPVIQQVINEVFVQGFSVNLARKVKFLFNQFFEHCLEIGLVEHNPTNRIKIRQKDSKQVNTENMYKAIPEDERLKFVYALNNRDDFLKPLCMTMMFGGLRIGEVLALKWKNINFKDKTIDIQNGLTIVPTIDKEGNVIKRTTVIGDTKTDCSVREVPIPDLLIDVLKDWKKCQWVKRELYGVDLISPDAIVFCNDDGSVRTYSGTRNVYNRFAKKHGFDKKFHFHTLRHTYSAMLFENKENPKIIQALLGHKSVKTTLTVYNSVDKSHFKEATDKLNALINSDKMKEYQEFRNKKDIPALRRSEEELEEDYTDPEIEMLEKILAEKKEKLKQKKDFEM